MKKNIILSILCFISLIATVDAQTIFTEGNPERKILNTLPMGITELTAERLIENNISRALFYTDGQLFKIENYNEKGQVTKFEWIYYGSNPGVVHSTNELSYNEKGQLIKEVFSQVKPEPVPNRYVPDYTKPSTAVYNYNEQGDIIERSYTNYKYKKVTDKYTYDVKGRVLTHSSFYDGVFDEKEEYKYDELGREVEKVHGPNRDYTNTTIYDSKESFNYTNTIIGDGRENYWKYEFNDANLATCRKNKYKYGYDLEHTYEFDKNNVLIKYTHYNYDGYIKLPGAKNHTHVTDTLLFKNVSYYTYNDNGLPYEFITTIYNELNYTTSSFVYLKKGESIDIYENRFHITDYYKKNYPVGSLILALDNDNYWYAGKITSNKDNKFTVTLLNGKTVICGNAMVKPVSKWEIDEPILFQWQGEEKWYSGKLKSIDGENAVVSYNKGKAETTLSIKHLRKKASK